MTKDELKQDMTIYLHLKPDTWKEYTFEELFRIAQRLPQPNYKMFVRRYGHLVENLLG